ncbi:MAG TPA: hypothetical protein VHM19_04910, partial [Polyangiales bacterium]|nr:hypothetical protein [Polyangiales bacterium]
MRNAAWFLLLWVVAGCANSCGCGHDQIEGSAFPGAADAPKTSSGVRPQAQAAAQPAQTANTADTQEGAPPVRAQKLNAPIVPWEELKPLAPDSFEGFTAIAEPTGRTMDLPTGGQLSSLTRRYSKGEDKLE